MVDLIEERPAAEELVPLYDAVGWAAYTRDPGSLARAIGASTWVLAAREDGRLVGLVRCVSDDVSIAWLQDVLVLPSHQRRGVGRALVEAALRRFAAVRQLVLLTDDRPEQTAFYEALGLVRLDRATTATLRTFARMPGLR
jgi:GNAT superfamily N-acetyltransferase